MTPSNRSAAGVVLIGCGPTAASALESLVEHFSVVGVVRDRGPHDESDDPVYLRAAELGVPLIGDTSIAAIDKLVAHMRPECIVVSSYKRVLPPRVLAGRRFVNVHYAPLPRYRGRATVSWAMINAEPETAISIHVLTSGLDEGNILFQQAVPFGPRDTVATVYERLNTIQRYHLGQTIIRHLAGDNGRPQDEGQATFACTRIPRDGEIDWSQPTRRVYDLIRALVPPYPGAFTYMTGQPLRIWRASVPSHASRFEGRVPGRIVHISRDHGWVDVLTGDGILRLHEVEVGNDSPRPAAEVITSVCCTLGLHTLDLLERIRALEQVVSALSSHGRHTSTS